MDNLEPVDGHDASVQRLADQEHSENDVADAHDVDSDLVLLKQVDKQGHLEKYERVRGRRLAQLLQVPEVHTHPESQKVGQAPCYS